MTVAVLRYIMIALAIASFTPLARGEEPPRVPFPQHVTYAPKTIRPLVMTGNFWNPTTVG